MNWLLGLSNTWLGKKILGWISSKLIASLTKAVSDWWSRFKQSIIDRKNVKKYEESVNGPVEKEINENGPTNGNSEFSENQTEEEKETIKNGEDLLNGRGN